MYASESSSRRRFCEMGVPECDANGLGGGIGDTSIELLLRALVAYNGRREKNVVAGVPLDNEVVPPPEPSKEVPPDPTLPRVGEDKKEQKKERRWSAPPQGDDPSLLATSMALPPPSREQTWVDRKASLLAADDGREATRDYVSTRVSGGA